MSSEKYIGLDVHQATISVAVMDSQGKVVMECILETKASTLLEFLADMLHAFNPHTNDCITFKGIQQYAAQCVSDGNAVARLQRTEFELCFEIGYFLKNDLIGLLKI